MRTEDISRLVRKQRAYFSSGATLPVEKRIAALKKLRKAVKEHEEEIAVALRQDLGKSPTESFMCETGMLLSELSYMIKHLPAWAKDRRRPTPLAQFAARSYEKPSPYGVTLIMSPWNYPILLTLDPLVNALAAGNTAIIKPSAYSPASSALVAKLLGDIFPEEHVAVVTGDRAENQCLLDEKFDYIFFTGSTTVGKLVLEKASRYVTPVTLELGGKSPCIVDSSADLPMAARRIVFGKYLNCGQTCVAPDYIWCHASVKDKLVEHLKSEIDRQYKNAEYGRIINEKHFTRLLGLMDAEKVIYGGESDLDALRISPTLMDNVTWDDSIMEEEIFGPILPILTFDSIDEVITELARRPKPLALYLFSLDRRAAEAVTSRCSYGGGCINDTIIHLATSGMGFGGVGESGMGAYHGKAGFDTFTHYKRIVDKKNWIDLPMRYQPYTKNFDRMLRMFLK